MPDPRRKPAADQTQQIKTLVAARTAAERVATAVFDDAQESRRIAADLIRLSTDQQAHIAAWRDTARTDLDSCVDEIQAATQIVADKIRGLVRLSAEIETKLVAPCPGSVPVPPQISAAFDRLLAESQAHADVVLALSAERDRLVTRSTALARVEADGLPTVWQVRVANAFREKDALLPPCPVTISGNEAVIYDVGLRTTRWAATRRDAMDLAKKRAVTEPIRDVEPTDLTRAMAVAFHGAVVERDSDDSVTLCLIRAVVITNAVTDPHAAPPVPIPASDSQPRFAALLFSAANVAALRLDAFPPDHLTREAPFIYADRWGVGRPVARITATKLVPSGSPTPDGRELPVDSLWIEFEMFPTDAGEVVGAALQRFAAPQEATGATQEAASRNAPTDTGAAAQDPNRATQRAAWVAEPYSIGAEPDPDDRDLADRQVDTGPAELPEAPGGADQTPPSEPPQAAVA